MFRAIADYFFGGVNEEPQSTLETQEVNDWLVVNLKDRPQNDMVMIESTKVDPMSESEYEDILDAVSSLMRPVESESELEQSDGESTVESSDSEEDEEEDEEQLEVPYKSIACSLMTDSCVICTLHGKKIPMMEDQITIRREKFYELLCREHLLKYFLNGHCMKLEEVVEQFDLIAFDKAENIRQLEFNFHVEPEHAQSFVELNPDTEWFHAKIGIPPRINFALKDPYIESVTRMISDHTLIPIRRKKFVLPNNLRYDHMKSFTNIQPVYKAEIQRRIHEVERLQKLERYRNEKVLTKGQLNHQNKNYLFQSSCKKNRRRNLQRSHSGANNNRKCSC